MGMPESLSVQLTLEDDLTLNRIRRGAYKLKGDERTQYLWERIVCFVCRERAFKAVSDELGVTIDPNMDIFESLERDE